MKNLQEIRSIIAKSKRWDLAFQIVGLLSMLFGIVTLMALVLDLMHDGLPRLDWQFITSFPSRKAEEAGILSAWVGSALVMLVTAATSIPVGIAAGIYLEEYAKKGWLSDFIEINVTNLAGVPSIVYGLLALGLFVYRFKLGESVLTAGLTLALLVLPIVIVTTREALRAIPNSIREAAYAVGASKWQVIWDHVLRYSTGTILTGIIVGLARAIGETAPLITIGALTFISFLPEPPIQGQFPFISFKWLLAPFTVLPIQMFDWVSRPQEEFQVNAAAAGIALVLMTLAMNGVAIFLRYRLRKNIKW
ncbi:MULTISPECIES: phosphate ABC transporter permease PstA [Cyanophyceae]|uniref:phosphate ABC transporter permease PstA n=1 Tax=Cyanophyceae TaxID=3028117 RepID=UPI0016875341|nr:phosphate ABC transporter permease PstA [Trichocoleus sp. FACHB-69]MBD1932749.1 phosphate ABC transporter permease PstA [Trichocoleus sp. FACHB-69]